MYPQELIDYVAKHEKIKSVFMDDKGGWLLRGSTTYRNEVSREEILKSTPVPPAEKKEKAPTDKKK